jgi:hypothetical protein
MIKTMKKSSKKISSLNFEIEIINPIESKALFGGGGYNGWDSWYYDGNGITFNYGGSSPYQEAPATWTNYNGSGYANDWNNYGGYDNYGGGGGSSTWVDNNGDGVNDTALPFDCQITGLPTSVAQQIGNMCTFQSFTFTANLLGSNTTLNSITTLLAQNPNIGPMGVQDGLTTLQLSVAINNLFENTLASSIEQIQLALCNNQPTLAFKDGHEITIVGYDSANDTFRIADSQWLADGGYHNISQESIDMSNAYIITGVRP